MLPEPTRKKSAASHFARQACPWYNLPYGAIIGTAGVLFVEGFSVVENLRRKRSHAAEVADVAAKIVKCLTTEDAEKIIKMIKDNGK